MTDNYALKHCPHCGLTETLTIWTDPETGQKLVMCNGGSKKGCGALAPLEAWNMRREPLKLLLNTNPKVMS